MALLNALTNSIQYTARREVCQAERPRTPRPPPLPPALPFFTIKTTNKSIHERIKTAAKGLSMDSSKRSKIWPV